MQEFTEKRNVRLNKKKIIYVENAYFLHLF